MTTIFITAIVALLSGCASPSHLNTSDVLTPAEVQTLITNDNTIVILDVRSLPEFVDEHGHLKGAMLIPVQELELRIGELAKYKSQRIITVCQSGNRSHQAVSILKAHGFIAVDMTGGMTRWNAEGFPVEKTAK